MTTTTAQSAALRRSDVWGSTIKEVLEDDLMATNYVRWLQDFPDGETFNIPSIGQAQTDDYVEDETVNYRPLDTGNFQFTINNYKSAATYITKKNMQDMFYMNELVSSFVPKMSRAIMEDVEESILGLSAQQTLNNANSINGVAHRFVGTGASEIISVDDFARARYALKKANVPDRDLVAIVDPSVEYTLNTLTNISNVSNNPRWEGIIDTGIASGMSFVVNVFGFDVYTSQRLADTPAASDLGTVDGKANMFFSAASDVVPFVGAWRQMPEVESEYNKDNQREEHVVTARWGTKLYRPENLVCVLTNPGV